MVVTERARLNQERLPVDGTSKLTPARRSSVGATVLVPSEDAAASHRWLSSGRVGCGEVC